MSFTGSFVAGQQILNTMTRLGGLDIVATPDGTDGFSDLVRDAHMVEVLGQPVRLVSLPDLIRCKEAAGRDKDRDMLADLRFILGDPPT